MTRPVVVLYNPRAVFYTMPLALVALGSRLGRRAYDVRLVDGRLEPDPVAAVLTALAGPSVCLGVSVLTGAPIRDALAVTRAVRALRPEVPIVWGGWHPSLFALETLAQAEIDAVVIGQGEDTFAEVVERLTGGGSAHGVPGTIVALRSEDGSVEYVRGNPRPLTDVNAFPRHDYSLIEVSRYFALKGRRQLDYVSSQGCRFRCAFCADPAVYGRAWTGLEPARVGAELAGLEREYGVEDVNFQDETFFTNPHRVAAIAEELLRRPTSLTWSATMRADQAQRLDEAALRTCRRAGLRRVMMGVEAGSQEMLDRMKKDNTIEQVYAAADKCRRLGIGAMFNFIVGFPDETPESVAATLDAAKRIRAMSLEFEIAVFYYKPYPGNPIADLLVQRGYAHPRTLEEWAAFDYVGAPNAWLSRALRERIEGFKFYQRIAWSRRSPWRAPLQTVARWRCARDAYGFPLERRIIEWLKPSPRLS